MREGLGSAVTVPLPNKQIDLLFNMPPLHCTRLDHVFYAALILNPSHLSYSYHRLPVRLRASLSSLGGKGGQRMVVVSGLLFGRRTNATLESYTYTNGL